MTKLRILIADDQLHVRTGLKSRIRKSLAGHLELDFSMAETAEQAVEMAEKSLISKQPFDLITMDIKFSDDSNKGRDGHWAATEIQEILPQTLLIIVSSFPNEENLEKAEQNSAVTRFFSRENFTDQELFRSCMMACLKSLHRDQVLLDEQHVIHTRSPAMIEYLDQLDSVLPSSNTMIYGETGTGKELSALRLHANASYELKQSNRPFVAVNCGALPDALIEAELFGYKKGAFTGAHSDKRGLLAMANGGDLFLDELQNAPLRLQKVLMRAVQEKSYRPVGSKNDTPIAFDCRIISALNMEPGKSREDGVLMPDFIARLRTEYCEIPALRERPEDFELLIEVAKSKNSDAHKEFSVEALDYLRTFQWAENVRGFMAVIKAAMSHSKLPIITVNSLKRLPIVQELIDCSKSISSYKENKGSDTLEESGEPPNELALASETLKNALVSSGCDLPKAIEQIERLVFSYWMQKNEVNSVVQLSKKVGMPVTTVRRRLKILGLSSSD